MTGIYFGEIVEILFERKGDFYIKYDDGLEEFVPQNDVSDVRGRRHKKSANSERKTKKFIKHFGSKERVKRINCQPCVVCYTTPSQNAHILSKGAGGTYNDIIPLCQKCHAEQHQIGIKSFAEKYQIDLVELAKYYAEEFPT